MVELAVDAVTHHAHERVEIGAHTLGPLQRRGEGEYIKNNTLQQIIMLFVLQFISRHLSICMRREGCRTETPPSYGLELYTVPLLSPFSHTLSLSLSLFVLTLSPQSIHVLLASRLRISLTSSSRFSASLVLELMNVGGDMCVYVCVITVMYICPFPSLFSVSAPSPPFTDTQLSNTESEQRQNRRRERRRNT